MRSTTGAAGPPTATPRGTTPPAGFSVAADQTMLDALGKFGALEPHTMAVTVAFESFLSKLVASWRPHDVSRLSVNFLIAFGAELTRRLDVHHRIRSTKLSAQELARSRTLQEQSNITQSAFQLLVFSGAAEYSGSELFC